MHPRVQAARAERLESEANDLFDQRALALASKRRQIGVVALVLTMIDERIDRIHGAWAIARLGQHDIAPPVSCTLTCYLAAMITTNRKKNANRT
jgi:hypothetical protein